MPSVPVTGDRKQTMQTKLTGFIDKESPKIDVRPPSAKTNKPEEKTPKIDVRDFSPTNGNFDEINFDVGLSPDDETPLHVTNKLPTE